MKKEDNLPRNTLFNEFNDIIILVENNRVNCIHLYTVIFNTFLDRLRDSMSSEED